MDTKKRHTTKEKPTKDLRMAFRATGQDRAVIAEKARQCGLSLSEYIRLCAIGHKPRHRLTKREAEAYISLVDARRDLINMKNAMRKWTREQKRQNFNDPSFVAAWIRDADRLIARWSEIERDLTGQP